jgi:hypothetical protein
MSINIYNIMNNTPPYKFILFFHENLKKIVYDHKTLQSDEEIKYIFILIKRAIKYDNMTTTELICINILFDYFTCLQKKNQYSLDAQKNKIVSNFYDKAIYLTKDNVYIFFISIYVLVKKWLNDIFYPMQYYSYIFQINYKELLEYELNVFLIFDCNIYINKDEMYTLTKMYLDLLE